MRPGEKKIEDAINGWWILQYNMIQYPSVRSKRPFIVRHCESCDRAWEIEHESKTIVHYNRDDMPYYGLHKEICKDCV